MKKLLLLLSCDASHSISSFRSIGIFSNMNTLINFLIKYDNLTSQNIGDLYSIKQTQGRVENYFVKEFLLNPKFDD